METPRLVRAMCTTISKIGKPRYAPDKKGTHTIRQGAYTPIPYRGKEVCYIHVLHKWCICVCRHAQNADGYPANSVLRSTEDARARSRIGINTDSLLTKGALLRWSAKTEGAKSPFCHTPYKQKSYNKTYRKVRKTTELYKRSK